MSSPTASATTASSLRLLLLQAQSPFDPTSGAAQSMRQIAELLARQGATVRALSTSLCEGDTDFAPAALMAGAGAAVTALPRVGQGPLRWRAHHAGIEYEVMHVEPAQRRSWEHVIGRDFDRRLAALAQSFRPEIVLTFGGDPTDALRRQGLRRAGAHVVFALHNLAYLTHRPREVDTFLAPTEFLAARYRSTWNTAIAVLPPPIDPRHCRSQNPEPVCIGFFNPEPAKGAALVAHLAARLGRERPDVPLLVVGGRVTAQNLIAIGDRLGLPLAGLPNLLQATPLAQVSELLGACRVVLVPSFVEEAAGRIPVEAMANGTVPVVADRGGLPEMVGSAGIVLPLPESLTLSAPWEVPPTTVDAWWDALLPLIDDEAAWQRQSKLARQHAALFTPAALAPRYRVWFQALVPTKG